MIAKIRKQLDNISMSRRYWMLLLFCGLALMSTALFYQHVLGERPCLLCIQVRLWISLLIIVSLIGLLTISNKLVLLVMHSFTVFIAIALVERSYQLLGTERGFVFGDCGFDLGLPGWFALDQWLPSVYYVQTSCGYTPEIIFGITMAEALMLFSVVLLLFSVSVFSATLIKRSD